MDETASDSDAQPSVEVRLILLWLPERADPDDWRILSSAERERAGRFLVPAVAARYVHMRATLRRVLSDLEGRPAASLVLQEGPNGKPALSPDGVHFNMSHSHGIGVIAVSADAPVGVDVERIQPIEVDLIEPFFAPAERAALAALSGPDRLRGLYRCWCRKEAYVKALGVGLSLPLDSFVVSVEATPEVVLASNGRAEAWRLVSPDITDGYEAALAVRADGRPVRVMLDWETAGRVSPLAGSGFRPVSG